MQLIEDENLTNKLKNIKLIGNNTDDISGIYGVTHEEEFIPLSREIYGLVVFDLIDKKSKHITYMNREFKITVEQV